MKTVIKLSLMMGVLTTVLLKWETWLERMLPETTAVINTSLLMSYGAIIGFTVFIIFVIMIQHMSLETLKKQKPKISKTLFYGYALLGASLIMLCIAFYSFEKAIILAIVFMLITALFDIIKEKALMECQGNTVHPKRIM